MPAGAVTVSVALALPPLVNTGFDVSEQVSGLAAEQLMLTVPANPLFDARLMMTVPVVDVPASMGTIVVSGTIEKSESGLAMGLVSVNADGA